MTTKLIDTKYPHALLLVWLLCCIRPALAAEAKPLVIGMSPFISTVALFQRFSPLSHYLSAELGREVVLDTARNSEEFLQKLYRHEYDLVFASPLIALRALDGRHYDIGVISARETQPLIMVGAQSNITHIAQLAQKRVALPPEGSTISFMAERWFISRGIKAEELPQFIHYNSHNAAYQATLSGDVDAAFVVNFAVKQLRKKLPILKIIDSADYLPGSSILYANTLDGALREQLTALLVKLKETPQGQEVLNKISLPPFRNGDNSEYEGIRLYLPAT